jgi:hypothetical protein
MPKRIFYFIASLLPALATSAGADHLRFEGDWVAGQPVSAGISSENGWEGAEAIEGRAVSITGHQLALPNGVTCLIGAMSINTWHNDMEHFGSGGGTWSDIGLSPVGGDNYPIILHALDCGAGGPYNLIDQVAPFLLLLEFEGRVFVPLVKPSSSEVIG